jgi:FtsZ-binding cell division protein ZapB
MSNFVAKLRARTRPEICDCAIGIHLADGSEPDEDCVKAADTITRLTAEVEREKTYGTTMHAEWEKQREENARVKAENERLWEAKRGTDNVTSRLTAEVEKLRAVVEAADKLRNGIRAAGVKRMPELYLAVMAFDAARATSVLRGAVEASRTEIFRGKK